MLVHGDPHPGNLLRVRVPRPGAETGWCFVDPEPFVADRAYDLGVAVRDFSDPARRPGTALDAPVVVVPAGRGGRAVSTPAGSGPGVSSNACRPGSYVTSFGAHRVAEPFLRSAALLDA